MIRIGHDVEVFINDDTTNTVVPGDKFLQVANSFLPEPSKIQLGSNSDSVLEMNIDNVMLELNPPPQDWTKFKVSTIIQIDKLKELMRTLEKEGFNWSISPFHTRYAEDCLDHPSFGEFNCRPSLNAWTGKVMKAKTNELGMYRVAGGHIHFESNDPNDIKIMDLFLGISEILFKNQELTLRKQSGYGEAGNFRMRENPSKNTKYILEYRTVSNFWVFDNSYTDLISSLIALTTQSEEFKDQTMTFLSIREKEIVQCINNIDLVLGYTIATELLNYVIENNKSMVNQFHTNYLLREHCPFQVVLNNLATYKVLEPKYKTLQPTEEGFQHV